LHGLECPDYLHGERCDQECHCSNTTEVCDKATGYCFLSAKCFAGWKGLDCSIRQYNIYMDALFVFVQFCPSFFNIIKLNEFGACITGMIRKDPLLKFFKVLFKKHFCLLNIKILGKPTKIPTVR